MQELRADSADSGQLFSQRMELCQVNHSSGRSQREDLAVHRIFGLDQEDRKFEKEREVTLPTTSAQLR